MTAGENNVFELVDREELQHLQEELCRVSGISLLCLDGNRLTVTDATVFGVPGIQMQELVSSRKLLEMLDNVGDGSLEDVYPEDFRTGTGDFIHAATMAIRIQQKVLIYWVAAAPIDMSEDDFWVRLDLLRDICNSMFFGKILQLGDSDDLYRDLDVERERDLLQTNVLVREELNALLDNTENADMVLKRWLETLSNYLSVDNAQIFRVNSETEMDILAEFNAPGTISPYDRKTAVPVIRSLFTGSVLTISSDEMDRAIYPDLADREVRATMIFPIMWKKGEFGNIVVALNYSRSDHRWTKEEVRFSADAGRILQSVLLGRINRNSVTSSIRTLEEILNNVGCSVYLTSKASGKVIFMNRMLMATFGEEMKSGKLLEMVEKEEFIDPDNGSFEFFYPPRERWYDLVYKKVNWVDGSEAMLYSLYDITDRKMYQRRIEKQAFTDFLTGLYNRMCCERDLARLIDEAKKTGTGGALVYLDLDNFKHINDGLGHQYGDVLLKSISAALQGVKGIEETCYRMGGDEFVILIPPRMNARLEDILKDIKDVFNHPFYLKDSDYYATASIGVVTFPDLGESVADLIRKADIAMYEAKKSGKNRLARYTEGQASASGRRLDMEKNMRAAEGDNYKEFEVYYQPIIDVEDGNAECVGAEALVRWNSNRLGFISPADFIPLAEYLGLINPIGSHVLREACETCKYWNDNGSPNKKVNVNLSVVQLLQNDIVDEIAATMEETGINPKNLCLEVTESLAINDMPRMQKILSKIKELGVSIALDDFGTGYSSLNHIREIPFDIIKVDQSFVRELADDAYSQSFVKMVAELAETIGVKICVEGIETANQLQVLFGMKVKYIQGYYFDRPMSRSNYEAKYIFHTSEE